MLRASEARRWVFGNHGFDHLNVMKPQLVQSIAMIGSDGQEYTVQMWQTFRWVKRSTVPGHAGWWVPRAFPELCTDDRRIVDCEKEEEGIFRIRGTDIVLRRPTQS